MVDWFAYSIITQGYRRRRRGHYVDVWLECVLAHEEGMGQAYSPSVGYQTSFKHFYIS